MALGPISTPGIAPSPPLAPARNVSNAQRAFFQAALGQATLEPAAPVTALAAVAAPTPEPARAPEPPRAEALADAPKAAYRPGSLLDVRI